jgi:hypothetical protein
MVKRFLRDNEAQFDELGSDPGQVGSDSSGQSGDTQGLSHDADSSEETVEELADTDQAYEAGILKVWRMPTTTPRGRCIPMRIRARQRSSRQNPLKVMDGTPRRVDKGRAQGCRDLITCSSLRFETSERLEENRDGDYQTTCRCRQFARIDANGRVRGPNLGRAAGFSGLSGAYSPVAPGWNDGVRGR